MLTLTEETAQTKSEHGIMNRLANALVREKLLPVAEEDNGSLVVQLNSGARLIMNVTYKGAFLRYTFASPFYLEKNGETSPVNTVENMLRVVAEETELQISDDLARELLNSRDNLSLAYDHFEQKKIWARRQADTTIWFHKKKKPTHFLQFLSLLTECRDFDELVYSEALVIEGHPLHPSTKTKLGLSMEDVRQHAPEFEREIMLKTVLVRCDHVMTSETGKPMLYEQCPDVERAAEHILQSRGERMENYHPFLLHPWQYEHVLPSLFAAELSEKKIIPLPTEVASSATLSFRTMSLSGKSVHAKLPVNVQATSAVRTVSPEIAVNGPLLSERLVPLLSGLDGLTFLPEYAGSFFGAGEKEERSRQLSYILRQSPSSVRKEGELLLVGASLTSASPLNGEPVVLDIIKEHTGKETVTAEDVYTFARHYSESAGLPILRALITYGAGLEAHMQNTILAVKNGRITNVVMRDLGGVRIHKETISQHISMDGIRDASIFTEKKEEAHSKFLHAFVQNHLGDLWFTLASTVPGVDENKLWRITSDVFRTVADDQHPIFDEHVKTKALLSMRMNDAASEYEYSLFHNPLHSREG